MQKKNRGLLIGAIVLVVLLIGASLLYAFTRPTGEKGDKTITVEVVYDKVDKTVTIRTDEAYLRGALEQKKLASGQESEYGLFIQTVDGRTADSAKQEWWCITKAGEAVMTGADTTPIADGDAFELTLKTGYDF